MRACAIDTCDNTISDKARSTTVYCVNCRSSLAYWNKMPVQRIVLRREKLKLYSTRVTRVIDTKKRGAK